MAEFRNQISQFFVPRCQSSFTTAMVSETIKKRRYDQESKPSIPQPKIFQPFRAIGYVTNDVPATFEARGQDFFMTTCVGKNFQIYNVGLFQYILSRDS